MVTNLLDRQIKKYLDFLSEKDKKKFSQFFDAVKDAYDASENDRILMDESLEMVSNEMLEQNEKLREYSKENEKIINNLIDSIKELDTNKNLDTKTKLFDLSDYLKNLIKNDIKNKQQIIKQQKETEKLNIELEKFKQAVDNASDFISIVDKNRNIIFMNKSFKNEIGYPCKKFKIPFHCCLLREGEQKEDLEKIWKHLIEEKKSITKNLRTIRSNGSSFISKVHITPIFDNKKNILFYLLIEHDVTREVELDNMKNEFLSIASHELRTPMTAINGYNSILLEEDFGKINETQKKYLGKIELNIENLIKIVNDMLDIGKLESGKMKYNYENFDIFSLLEEVKDAFQDMCDKKQIKLTIKSPKIDVFLDRVKTKQVLVNLLGNSYKFTDEGGSINIKVEKHNNTDIKVSVSDNGVGIKNEHLKRLFQKFYQVDNYLKEKQEGTGLGLSICKTIIGDMGGEIHVDNNNEAGGTEFYFYLPIKRKEKTIAEIEKQ